jgi:hypothetical protein
MPDAPRDLAQCIDGFRDLFTRLTCELAIDVRFVPLPGKSGALDGSTRTLLVNIDKPLEDQLWTMNQAWNILTIGPEASPDAVVQESFMHLVAG